MLKTDQKTKFLRKTLLVMAMASAPLLGHAAGLGKISVYSTLGQPLKAEIEITATAEELSSLRAKLASLETFSQAEIDYNPVLSELRFSNEVTVRNGHQYIQLTTDKPVNEPFLNMLVELNWSAGKLVREYTFLLDPPGNTTPSVAASVAPPVVSSTNLSGSNEPVISQRALSNEASPPAANAEVRSSNRVRKLLRNDFVKKTQPSKPLDTEKSPSGSNDQSEKEDTKQAAGEQSLKVRAGDTLRKIAMQTKPNGASLDQMLVALLRSNQDAFVSGNMNRLKAGKILMVPDAETVSKVSESEAREEVVTQAADFNAYRAKLAAMVAERSVPLESNEQVAAGKIAPKVDDKTTPINGLDKLEVSRAEGKSAKDKKPSVADQEVDRIASEKAKKEAESRAHELEEIKRLAELKNQQVADPKTVTADNVPGSIAPAMPAISEAQKAEPQVKVKKTLPLPEPEPEPGFFEENSSLVFGAGGILALLLGWLGFSAWKKKKNESELLEIDRMSDFSSRAAPSDLTSDAVVAASAQEQGFSQMSVTSPVSVEPSFDALSQAETFLAFGRNAEAEGVLRTAIDAEPERHPLYLKLLSVYAQQKKVAEFEALAQRFYTQTAGSGEDWDAVCAMGVTLDPGNALYAPKTPDSDVSAHDVSAQSVAAVMVSTPIVNNYAETSASSAESGEQIEALVTQESAAVNTDELDFDLDFDLDDTPVEQAEARPTDSLLQSVGASEASSVAEEATVAKVADLPDLPAMDFSLDLDIPSVTPPVPLDVDISRPDTPDNSIDFDFDLPLAGSGGGDEIKPALSEAATEDEGNVIDFNLDLAMPEAAHQDNSFAHQGDGDNPEVATKLELAAAYEEMGDNAGAKELYLEALNEGSSAQKTFAQAKLNSLS